MIKISDSALERIRELLTEEPAGTKLRVFVQGGGCAGFQYGFTFDEAVNEDDFTNELDGVTVLVDSMSAQYLQTAEIDYEDGLMGAGFKIKNPNAETTCGCGSSFSPSF